MPAVNFGRLSESPVDFAAWRHVAAEVATWAIMEADPAKTDVCACGTDLQTLALDILRGRRGPAQRVRVTRALYPADAPSLRVEGDRG